MTEFEKYPDTTRLKLDRLVSEMAEALGLKSFSLITRTGFGCYSCHLGPTTPNLAADRLFIPLISDAMPESLPFADFREIVLEMKTGLMRTLATVSRIKRGLVILFQTVTCL